MNLTEPPSYNFNFFLNFSLSELLPLLLIIVTSLFVLYLNVIAQSFIKVFYKFEDEELSLIDWVDKDEKFKMLSKFKVGFEITLIQFNLTVKILLIYLLISFWFRLFEFQHFSFSVLYLALSLFFVFGLIELFSLVLLRKSMKKVFIRHRFWISFFHFVPPFSWLRILFRQKFSEDILKSVKVKVSTGELEKALELTKDEGVNNDEHKILEGIVKFGNTEAKQIMKSRIDMFAIEKSIDYSQVLSLILEAGYSRIPVYENRQDYVIGVLYIKDLLPFLNEDKDFEWFKLVREPYFIPENKKIDDLMREFQQMKTHIAIVVDEYGVSSGMVTMEDVLEEIVGEINDEFDDDEIVYSKINDFTYVFEGRTTLNDFYRITDIEEKTFESMKGEAETLGGFVVEVAGRILKNNEYVFCDEHQLIVEASDKRRIKMIKVILKR